MYHKEYMLKWHMYSISNYVSITLSNVYFNSQNYISDNKYFKVMLIGNFSVCDPRNVKYILKFYFDVWFIYLNYFLTSQF